MDEAEVYDQDKDTNEEGYNAEGYNLLPNRQRFHTNFFYHSSVVVTSDVIRSGFKNN